MPEETTEAETPTEPPATPAVTRAAFAEAESRDFAEAEARNAAMSPENRKKLDALFGREFTEPTANEQKDWNCAGNKVD